MKRESPGQFAGAFFFYYFQFSGLTGIDRRFLRVYFWGLSRFFLCELLDLKALDGG